MNRSSTRLALCAFTLAASALAQNRLGHFDGTTELASRGAPGITDTKRLIQRVPADQACGATRVKEVQLSIQDNTTFTIELFTVEVRRNNPAIPGTPDVSPAGLIFATSQLVAPFPGVSQAEAIIVNVQFPAPGVLLPLPGPSPAGDWYLCVVLPPAPSFPSDGLSLAASAANALNPGEQMDPLKAGYAGVANQAGLAFDHNATTGALLAGTFNRSWFIIGRYGEDTFQPFASSPAFTGTGGAGLNPNFGYAGIFPNFARVVAGSPNPDDIGFRCLTASPVGSTCVLALAPGMASPPFGIGGAATGDSALLCLDPVTLFLYDVPTTTVAPPAGEPSGSQAIFGPFDGTGLGGLGPVFFQSAVVVGSQVRLSTMCKVVF